MLRPGTYRDVEGNLVVLTRTETGYAIEHADGTVTLIGAAS